MNKNRVSINYDGKIAGLYDLGDTLGRGHFAVVKLARHVFTGEQVAVKVIDKTKLDEVSRAHLFQEVRCMKLVQHPNVVRLYEVIDTQTKLYLILELGDGGDMYDYIMKHEKGVDEETAKKYFRQIVNAISYCHKLHVVHRDLKPENVVFFEKLGVVKLTDFGFSNKFCPGQKLETSCGSLAYSAPEILLGDSYDAPKVDVWSLGVILYMMVCGHAPFQEANDSETLTMIMDCKYTIPSYISNECQSLIERMLIRDPEKRATLEQIANDPWLTFGYYTNSVPECLPLVSREHLSEEDHAHIIQKMVNGNIATKEEILDSLDKNDYNHITATYFLLAERKLRLLRNEKAQLLNNNNHSSNRLSRADLSPIAVTPGISSATPSPAQEKLLTTVDGLISPCLASNSLVLDATSPLSSNVQRLTSSASSGLPMMLELPKGPTILGRKCSIVREEEDSSASASNSPTKSPCQDISSRLLIVPEQLGKIVEDTGGMSLSFSENSFRYPETTLDQVKVQSTMPSNTIRQKLSLPVSNSATALRNIAKDQTVSPVNFNSPSKRSLAGLNSNIRTAGGSHSPVGLISPGSVAKCKTLPSPGRRLHSVQSSPHLLLNEINEDDRDSDSGSGACVSQLRHHRSSATADQRRKKQNCYLSKLQSHGTAVSHAMLRIMGKRHKFVKNRTASCSSSDASDDEENLKRRMGKIKPPNPRRKDGDNHDGSGNSGNNGGGDCSGSNRDGDNGGNSGNDQGGAGGSGQDKGSQGFSRGSGNSSPNMDSLDLSQTEERIYEEIQSAHLSHVVFSTDSTDSLDLIAEPQPRLVSSVSCGDLSSGEVAAQTSNSPKVVCYSVSEAEDLMVSVDPVVRIETLVDGHQVASRKTSSNKTSVSNTPSHKNREIESIGTSVAEIPSIGADVSLSAKLRSKLSNSLSLNSGLSCLQNANSSDSLAPVPSNKNSGGRSTPKSPLKQQQSQQQQLDINQNGWKKHGKQAKSVVDVKMASKCCTLC